MSARLSKAELALEKLAKKPPQDEVALQTKVETILKRYRVTGQLLTSIEKKISYRKVYQGAGRGSQNRPSRRVRQTTLSLTYQRCKPAILHQQSIAGWRLYVTNAHTERLTLEQAVNSYREQWQPERGFHRFKRGRLPALPIYFQNEERIRGLMFLLTIALTLFTKHGIYRPPPISGGTAISFGTLSRITQTSDFSSHCRKIISCLIHR